MKGLINTMNENTLAIIVLVFLLVSLITSLILILRSSPINNGKNWYTAMIPIFASLGLPGITDLMRTGGNTGIFAILIFLVLISALLFPITLWFPKVKSHLFNKWWKYSFPLIVAAGLLVAGYLAYVELTAGLPVCGVGMPGCVTVQTSQYARLFNLIPIGVIGVVGYLAIAVAVILGKQSKGGIKRFFYLAAWGMCFFGVLFSSYLTYLEPFVIHATCTWCITSAVLMILLLWITTPVGQKALNDDQF